MPDTPYLYPFDPTGRRADNHIAGEQQVLTPSAWRDFHFIIPKMAPFFQESLILYHKDAQRIMEEGVDYILTHRFYGASKAIMKPVYGSILFYDKTLAGIVEITYQTLGGEWTVDSTLVNQILSQKQTNPRITTWEQVSGEPTQFPVIDHEWNLTDMVGMTEVKDAIEGLALAVENKESAGSGFLTHIHDSNNPHGTTKEHVLLGLVENFPISTRAQARAGTHDYSYMTPRRVCQAFEQFIFALEQRVASLEHELQSLKDNTYTKAEIDAMFAALVDREEMLNTHLAADNPHEITGDTFGIGDLENRTLETVLGAHTIVDSHFTNHS